jgi:DNA polymerase-3 subunit epsilon/ATP-dependent DNA helicase DinG
MAERIYVALDLETTGLDANRDAIIEIGAVRFQGDHILNRFVTFVNPQRTLPLRIQQITGIRQSDLANAPTIHQVAPELLDFLRSDVRGLVAHNVAFDVGFLTAAGIRLHYPALDTFQLATILLPQQASYNLGELCHSFGIPLVDAHRALDDAQATAQLFLQLQQRLHSLPIAVLDLIVQGAQGSDWSLLSLFEEAQARQRVQPMRLHTTSPLFEPFDEQSSVLPLEAAPQPQTIAPEMVEQFFAPDGPLAQQMGPTYEVRSGQVRMAQQVMHAFNTDDYLLIEAGTGTGKSLAYLLPAALWSVANGQRVAIATNTLALQDQLLHKDIPQLQKLLQRAGQHPPQVAVLKGRNHYLCTRRFHAWRTSHLLTANEAALAARVLVWLTTTTTGDMGELFLATPADKALAARFASDATTCSPERCGFMPRVDEHGLPAGDFFLHARQQAEVAHLLVVNHALLLVDVAAGGRILPTCDYLVVDEAHHLEEVTTDQLTMRVDWRGLSAQVRRLTSEGDLVSVVSRLAAQHQMTGVHPLLAQLVAQTPLILRLMQEFAGHLLQFTIGLEQVRQESSYAQRVALDGRLRAQPLWSELEIEWEQVSDPLADVIEQLGILAHRLNQAQWWQAEESAACLNETQSLYDQLHEAQKRLDAIIFSPKGQDGLVRWLELNESADSVALAAAPLFVNQLLEEALVHQRRSAIFTSATLRAGPSFDFIQERLGLWEVKTAVVESPFDYERSTLLYLPANLPAPNHPHYQQAVEQAICAAAQAAQGRTLVLFTSYGQLRTTADAISGLLHRANITVLQQGSSGRNRVLREYRQTERAVLLGTRSFWEGIDLPGDELRCLLIVRLPFATPGDPLVAARSAALDDAFVAYTLPDAVLRFRQGFGRLIRRATDRGVVVLLDSRAWQKEYGRAFLESLPSCTVQRGPLTNLEETVKKWLNLPNED